MDQLKERWPESHLPMSLELIRTSVAWVCPAEQMKALDEGTGLGHLHSHAIGCLQGWRDLSKQTNKQTKQNKQTNSRDGPLDSWLSHLPKWRCACSHQRNSRGEIRIGLSGELTISPPLKIYIYIYLLNNCQTQRVLKSVPATQVRIFSFSTSTGRWFSEHRPDNGGWVWYSCTKTGHGLVKR